MGRQHLQALRRRRKSGRLGREIDYISRYDYHLAPWLRTGKLLWIAPDDPTLTLPHGTGDCPYLHIEGAPHFTVIYEGKLHYSDTNV